MKGIVKSLNQIASDRYIHTTKSPIPHQNIRVSNGTQGLSGKYLLFRALQIFFHVSHPVWAAVSDSAGTLVSY